MAGKVCVVTGASGGIGRMTALELARRGATVIAVARNRARGEALVRAVERQGGGGRAEFVAADLSSQAEIRRLAGEIGSRFPAIDVLVNNAGGMFGRRQLSVDGIEMTFALNHLGYFLLTHLLLPSLQAAAPARIVNVASDAHWRVTLDLDDLQSERDYRGFPVYSRSKLANVLFTYELARRLAGSGVSANALHPGFVASDIGAANGWTGRWTWRAMTALAATSVRAGARTPVHLASEPALEGVSGGYFVKRQPAPSSEESRDEGKARRLWEISAELTGV